MVSSPSQQPIKPGVGFSRRGHAHSDTKDGQLVLPEVFTCGAKEVRTSGFMSWARPGAVLVVCQYNVTYS